VLSLTFSIFAMDFTGPTHELSLVLRDLSEVVLRGCFELGVESQKIVLAQKTAKCCICALFAIDQPKLVEGLLLLQTKGDKHVE